MNSLLQILWHQRKIQARPDVRLFRMQMKSKLPQWDCPPEGKLTVSFRFHQPWYYQNGSMKRQDVPNLIKCCLDCLAERYGFDDSRIWVCTCEKVESEQVGIEVYLQSLEAEGGA